MTNKDIEKKLGQDIRSLRVLKNIDRVTLCKNIGISLNALRNLEL